MNITKGNRDVFEKALHQKVDVNSLVSEEDGGK